MRNLSRFLVLSFFFISSPALAQQRLELDNKTRLQNAMLREGEIKVIVDYKPIDFGEGDSFEDKNLEYTLFYQGEKILDGSSFTAYQGSVFLKDLNNNGTPEVIIQTYSGGAHCCTSFMIYGWQNNQFIKTDIGFLDGGGGQFIDLDQDGDTEFITSNHAFLYQFSPYAGSFPPTMIFEYENGELVEVTRNYPQRLEATATRMYQAFLENKKQGYEVNGILAGYVAQKILLGEYNEGWNFMLANYDQDYDWGLEIYKGQEKVGMYPDFPTALGAFLIEQGYLQQ